MRFQIVAGSRMCGSGVLWLAVLLLPGTLSATPETTPIHRDVSRHETSRHETSRHETNRHEANRQATDGHDAAAVGISVAVAPTALNLAAMVVAADDDSRDADKALNGLTVGDGLEATLFAAEPIMANPTNIDIDHLGRVWVCEVVNYRRFRNTDFPERTAGDRILILEDANHDGTAEQSTVFYQGRDIDSAHGLCVLPTADGKGTRAIVSAKDQVFFLIDVDGDLRADRKEVLFTGISGTEHDHGIHAFVFGPDGRLYFNFGNAGKQIKDKDGKPIIDLAGNEVNDSRQPYQEGMVFRCNMDGDRFETLGWNFRNNWEVCVDSFGTLWQSDNDDDGNRGTRINFVMEFGNYGYKDELNGAGWRDPRTGMHDDIPLRHWHLNDPGVVPNLLQTGAGSPTGILCYEGDLLPEVYRNQLIHCDAGPNIVRAYPARKAGAGYTAEVVPILEGTGDKWFRPSDVCVAPDGSLIVADWYDPGVGGHRMEDIERGRLFRVAPPGSKYSVPAVDVSTIDGAIMALTSPNQATRFLGWTALRAFDAEAEPALRKMFTSDPNPRFRARAMWLLAPLTESRIVKDAIADAEPDLRIAGLRLARMRYRPLPESKNTAALTSYIGRLINDPDPQVRRECAIALSEFRESTAGQPPTGNDASRFHFGRKAELWARLASHHDGQDRWFLEALGIAARADWNPCLDAWLSNVGDEWNSPAGRDIVWRSRNSQTPDLLAKIISDPSVPRSELPRYLRAFDFLSGTQRDAALTRLAFASYPDDDERWSFVMAEAVNRVGTIDFDNNPQHKAAFNRILKQTAETLQFLKLVDRFNLADQYPAVLGMAQTHPNDQRGIEAIVLLLAKKERSLLREAMTSDNAALATATATALANAADGRAGELLLAMIDDDRVSLAVRRAAVGGAIRIRDSASQLVERARSGKLDPSLTQAAASAMHSAPFRDVKDVANELFPLPPAKDNEPLPPIDELVKMKNDVAQGRVVFNTTGTCMKCHVVNGIGREVGPDLSEIGRKLSREALFQSILYPSAGVSHNYETWTLQLESGTVISGILISETDEVVSIRDVEAIIRTIKRIDIEGMVRQNISLMPADLQKVMTLQELVDVVGYTETLTEKKTK